MDWNPNALPDARGRVYAVTGATAGIGYFAAEQLASSGAEVVLVSRSPQKLHRATEAIAAQVPGARTRRVVVDLASLGSVRAAADELAALPRLDGVLLNGGVMQFSGDDRSAEGYPLLLATHHLANVALIAHLLPTLIATAGQTGGQSRIVHTSSGFVQRFRLRVGDLLDPPRVGVLAYTHAKTATEILAYELDRRLRAAELPVASILTRPGVGADAKTPHRPGIRDATTPYQRNPLVAIAQGKDTAAWSAVRAMLDPTAVGGDYFSPAGAARGPAVRVAPNPRTARPAADLAQRVWSQTEELIGRQIMPA